jgi:hypothetical protein
MAYHNLIDCELRLEAWKETPMTLELCKLRGCGPHRHQERV